MLRWSWLGVGVVVGLLIAPGRVPIRPVIATVTVTVTVTAAATEAEPVAEPQPEPAPVPVAAPGPVLGARAARRTIAAWNREALWISRDDGVHFTAAAPGSGVFGGAAVAGDGTVYAVRAGQLAVIEPQGAVVWRALPIPPSYEPPVRVHEVFVDGRWLGVVADGHVALTDDDGRSWRVFEIPGEAEDWEQHAAVIGGTLITTGAAYGWEGIDSFTQRRALAGGPVRRTSAEYAEVAGIGHDGEVYLHCAGAVCGPDDEPRLRVVRGPGVTVGVRDGDLVRLRRGRVQVLTRDVPDDLYLVGVDAAGRALGVTPGGSLLRWSKRHGWKVVLAR